MTKLSKRARRLSSAAAVWCAASAAGCSPLPDDTSVPGPAASVTPSSITLDAGDSSTVTIVSNGTGSVRWTSSNPAVATVDSLVLVGDAARVRARSRGSAVLNGTATINGVAYSTTVPVRVAG